MFLLNKNRILKVVAMSTLLLSSAATIAGNLGPSVKMGTLGSGLELDYAISDKFSIRGQVNAFSYDSDFEEDGIDYTGELDLSSVGALLDWRPFSGTFRVTAGGFANNSELTGFSGGEGSYEIGDRTYVVAPGGDARVDASVALGDGFAPYLGFGWGNNSSNKGGLMFSFDVGVLFQGAPTVNLSATGSATDQQTSTTVDLGSNAIVQNELAKEESNLEKDLEDYDLYPVISFGIGYRF